jgi:hypothetical protein
MWMSVDRSASSLRDGPQWHVIDPRSMRFASCSLLKGQGLAAFRSRLQTLFAALDPASTCFCCSRKEDGPRIKSGVTVTLPASSTAPARASA